MKKVCKRCGHLKNIEHFYAHPLTLDGRLSVCTECKKEEAKARYHDNKQDPEWVEAERERGREKYLRLYCSRFTFATPEATPEVKRHARDLVAKAVRKGTLVRPKVCPVCGSDRHRIEGHHNDYNQPLVVEWLCSRCHRLAHLMHKEPTK